MMLAVTYYAIAFHLKHANTRFTYARAGSHNVVKGLSTLSLTGADGRLLIQKNLSLKGALTSALSLESNIVSKKKTAGSTLQHDFI